MKTTQKTIPKTSTLASNLDKALSTKSSRQDARDVMAIRERKSEERVPASEVFKKAGL